MRTFQQRPSDGARVRQSIDRLNSRVKFESRKLLSILFWRILIQQTTTLKKQKKILKKVTHDDGGCH